MDEPFIWPVNTTQPQSASTGNTADWQLPVRVEESDRRDEIELCVRGELNFFTCQFITGETASLSLLYPFPSSVVFYLSHVTLKPSSQCAFLYYHFILNSWIIQIKAQSSNFKRHLSNVLDAKIVSIPL